MLEFLFKLICNGKKRDEKSEIERAKLNHEQFCDPQFRLVWD